MGHIVGIDLGTTYSAVAVPGHYSDEEGFLTVPECPGYSIIRDRKKNLITPSIVAEDGFRRIVVGYAAKGLAGFSPGPIMFSKRAMGEDKKFTLRRDGEQVGPREVAAHILRYLKAMAEERLGGSVDEAVITVPAYFQLRAKQMTEEAGKDAGLRVAQIAQEPVAAALMYCSGETRDPLRIMTYDLGGGTFDVAIVEKRDGTISARSIKAFDGDRFCGGYDFDQMIADWIEDQLNLKGYDLRLDLKNSSDAQIRTKLMVFAERMKVELTQAGSYKLDEPATDVRDHSGKQVQISGLELTRERFERLIGKTVDRTIALCDRALSTAGLRRDQIDEIVMVGGSSRIPLIGQRLKAEFGRNPRLLQPDLCVALGAAILAGTKPQTRGRLKLDPVPQQTFDDKLTVTGTVLTEDGSAGAAGCAVELRAEGGSTNPRQITGAEGHFIFDAVGLTPEASTQFTLTVSSSAGQEIAAHRFSIAHSKAAKGGIIEAVTNVLSKPIALATVDGVYVIAPERTPLPYEAVKAAATTDASGEIRIPILEGNNPMGEIVMKDIPTTLPIGTRVDITLTLQENYQICGRAYVAALGRETPPVVINIPVPPQKTTEELRREYELIGQRAEEALGAGDRGSVFERGQQLQAQRTRVEELLESRNPEPAKIQEALDDLDALARDMSRGWQPDPPRRIFDQKAEEAEDLLTQAIKAKPKVADDGYERQLAAIRAEGEKAFAAQNGAAWTASFEKLVKHCDKLSALIPPPPGPGDPSPDQLLLKLGQELAALEKWVKDQKLFERFKGELQSVAEALKKINPSASDAMTQIRDWYFTKLGDLKKRLSAPSTLGHVKILE